jgi:predicted PurR-regulated permease PerM
MTRLVARPARHTSRLAGRGNGAASGEPAGLPRGAVVLLSTACAVVTVAGIRGIADLLGPVLLALMLTVTVSPLTQWLRRHGVPTWLAMLATVLTVYLVLFALGTALFVSVARLLDLLPQYQAQFAGLREEFVSGLSGLGITAAQLHEVAAGAAPGTFVQLVEGLVGSLTGALSNTVFLLAVLLFMCLDTVGFPRRLALTSAERPQVVGALRSFAQGTRRYLLVCTVFGLIVAVADTLLLWWLAVPLPLLWGLLSFITNYIPNVGFIIGLIPPALLALLQGGPDQMLTVILLYCLVNFVIQSVVQPKVVGDAVGLSATVSFLALVFWTWVLGALGALLAIPLTLLAKGFLVDIDPNTRWLNTLLSGGPEPASPTRDEAAAPDAARP